MTITIEAVYENGVFKPKQPLDLTEGTEVRVTIRQAQEECDPLEAVIRIGRADGPMALTTMTNTFTASCAHDPDRHLGLDRPRGQKHP